MAATTSQLRAWTGSSIAAHQVPQSGQQSSKKAKYPFGAVSGPNGFKCHCLEPLHYQQESVGTEPPIVFLEWRLSVYRHPKWHRDEQMPPGLQNTSKFSYNYKRIAGVLK